MTDKLGQAVAEQKKYLLRIARGQTTKQIAAEFGLREAQAQRRISQLVRDLDSRDRTAAVVEALKHRIITLEEI